MMNNSTLIEKTVDITIAKMGNTNTPPNADGAKNVAEFMQVIYDKLAELNKASKD